MTEKIPLIPLSLENQKPTEVQECFVELHEKYLHYQMRFFADEPIIEDDKDSGWTNRFNSFNTYANKNKIAGVERSFTSNKKWAVYIMVEGFGGDIKCYFKKESESIEFADKILNWLFSL